MQPDHSFRNRPTLPPSPGRLSRPARNRDRGTTFVARDDAGSTVVEFAILFPIIVVLLFAGPQLAIWFFARDAAESAATAAARTASLDGAAPGAGRTSAENFLTEVGSSTITSYTVSETDTATTVTIHIHATVPNTIPVPGFNPTVDVTVVRGKERFTTPDSP